MTLLAPAFLWTLAALLPLGLLYLIRVRPRRKTTTAYFLWDKVLPETRPRRLFQQLRDLHSLLLLALAVTALALALADPRSGGGDERNLILILDTSASMNRREKGGKTRLDLAREAAAAWVRDLRGGRQAMLAAADGQVRQLARLTAHPPALLRALEKARGSSLPLDTRALAAFAAAALDSGGGRVLFFTDGNAARLEHLPASLECVRVGGSAPLSAGEANAALIAADLQPSPETSGALTALARVRHDFPAPVTGRLEISRVYDDDERELHKVLPLSLEPGQPEQRLLTDLPRSSSHTFASPPPNEHWRMDLVLDSGPDALPLDDQVDLVLPAPRPVRVTVLGDERFFPVQAVRAFETTPEGLEWVGQPAQADLALIVGEAAQAELAALPASAGRLLIRPQGASPWWRGLAAAPDPAQPPPLPVIEQPEHPLLRFLDAEGIDYRGARPALEMPAGSSLLVAGETAAGRVPLLYWVSQPEAQALVLNLDPAVSSFYLTPAFPVLVRNAALGLTRRETRPPSQLSLGQWVPLPAGATASAPLNLRLPDGETRALAAGQGWLVEQPGLHMLPALGWQGAAALLNPHESFAPATASLTPAGPVWLAGGSAPSGAGGRPWSWWLGLAALALVTFESLLYHRRRAG